jgi:predicted phosphodiesterase
MQRVTRECPKTFEIIAGSCTHVGSIMCHRNGIYKTVNYIRSTKNCYFIHLGDWIEAVMTDDKRYNAPPKELQDKEQPVPLLQADDAVSMFEPIKDRIIVGLSGNHERKLNRFGNIAKYICRELQIPYGTESCRIILNYKHEPMFNIFAMHGNRIFTSNAKDFEQRIANKKAALKLYLQEQMGNAAVMLCGHAHWIGIVPPAPRLYLVDTPDGMKQDYLSGSTAPGYISPDQRWYACCGSARKSRLDGYDDYAQNYPPVELGFVKIIVQDGKIKGLEPFLI